MIRENKPQSWSNKGQPTTNNLLLGKCKMTSILGGKGRQLYYFGKWKSIWIFWQRENKQNILISGRQKLSLGWFSSNIFKSKQLKQTWIELFCSDLNKYIIFVPDN